jgi:hypothetical protein
MLPTLILTTVLAATPAAETEVPSSEQVRLALERSLAYVQKSGHAWWNGNKCAGCHHAAISIWGLTEARQRGFVINDKALDDLRDKALTSYLKHPKLAPVGQDGGGDKLSLNTIHLALAAASAKQPDAQATEAIKKFAAHIIAKQEPDGSWASNGKMPPVSDITEVRTMQALLALSAAQEKGLVDDSWTRARDKALEWLKKTKLTNRNQSLALQVLVAQRFGKVEEVQALVKQLLQQQNTDGGWSQIKEMTSDAMATGQTLYVLGAAGVTTNDAAIGRAWAFLVKTQQKDGSWVVKSRAPNGTPRIISHYGSGWAALGLIRTLPAPVATKAPAKAEVITAEPRVEP